MAEEPITESEVVERPRSALEQMDQNERLAMIRREGREQQQAIQTQKEIEEAVTELSPYAGAGMLNLTKGQQEQLMAHIHPEDLDVTPDGNVYLPQVAYRKILFEVFGPGNWALVPMSDPKSLPPAGNRNTVVQRFQLRVYGKFASEAWGEGDFWANNASQSKATAAEAAKSNALMRCCKDLGIALHNWDRRFTEQYKREYCKQATVNGKTTWVRNYAAAKK